MPEMQEWKLKIDEAEKKLNLRWYSSEDICPEESAEKDIIKYIAENEPESYLDVIEKHYSWPVFYHLSDIRKNILNWYPFRKEASVLEIGCGCGAITGLLCDRCRQVTAVEVSKQRALATQLRCREKKNLEVIVGNLDDIKFDKKFDYITLIGGMACQGTYTNSEHPYKDFLIKLKSFLKDDGKLLLAIENKYGVKYWCGAVEEHSGIPFDGLNQYKLSGGKTRTFAREELKELLEESGYKSTYFYYPMPDYKLPQVIYSEKYMPQNGYVENSVPYYIPSNSTLVSMEDELYEDMVKNNVFEFMANSFLVECSPLSAEESEANRIVYALLNCHRKKEYRIGTLIEDSGKVIKFSLEATEDACGHLRVILQNLEELKNRGLKIWSYRLEGDRLYTDFTELPMLEDVLREAAAKGNKDLVWNLWDKLLKQIEMSSETMDEKDNIIYTLKLDEYREENDYGRILRKGYLDMIPRNCFVNGETYIWFDQEWAMENIPSKLILMRGIIRTFTRVRELNDLISEKELLEHYGLYDCLKVISGFEEMFYMTIQEKNKIEYYVDVGASDVCIKNIRILLEN